MHAKTHRANCHKKLMGTSLGNIVGQINVKETLGIPIGKHMTS